MGKSYFSNRLQFADFNVSSRLNISCGIPQGSILGPLFFRLYINDSNVVLSGKDPDCLV